jgi:predicted nuclease with TOPRIM domain
MRDRLEQRLQQLKAEFERGQQMLAKLEREQAGLRDSLLRIGGAIQVLEEELGQDEKPGEGAPG